MAAAEVAGGGHSSIHELGLRREGVGRSVWLSYRAWTSDGMEVRSLYPAWLVEPGFKSRGRQD